MHSSSNERDHRDRDRRTQHKYSKFAPSTQSSTSSSPTSLSSSWSSSVYHSLRSKLRSSLSQSQSQSSPASASSSASATTAPSSKQRWSRIRNESKMSRSRLLVVNNQNAAATALFSILAISPPNAKTLVGMSQSSSSSYASSDWSPLSMNKQYLLSPSDTFGGNGYGESTHSFIKPSTKGERTLSRFRLEFCPATASEIAAGCKPPRLFTCNFACEPTLCTQSMHVK